MDITDQGLQLQTDGNLVLYTNTRAPDGEFEAVWSTHTEDRETGTYLVVEERGNVVVYDYTTREELWESNTATCWHGELHCLYSLQRQRKLKS